MLSRIVSLPVNYMPNRRPRSLARTAVGFVILLGGFSVVAGDLLRLICGVH